jgi:hypothetical protein
MNSQSPLAPKLKQERLHSHISVTKSCFKMKESSQGSQDETINSTSSQGYDDSLTLVDVMVKAGPASTTITKKNVSFGRKASRKITISRQQFTKQERRNTWYTGEELQKMYLEAADEENSHLNSPESRTEPRPLSRHTWSLVRASPGKPIQEGHSYLTTKDHADLMGLTTQNVSPATTKTQLMPIESSSIVCADEKSPVQDNEVKTPTFSSRNRRSSSIFGFVQKRFQRRSASVMKSAQQQPTR